MSRVRPLTDSPWFWVLLFSTIGISLLFAIAPRYAKRQNKLEMQGAAFMEADRRRVEGEEKARRTGDEGEEEPPNTRELTINLWPIGLVLAAIAVLSGLALSRDQRRFRAHADRPEPPEPPGEPFEEGPAAAPSEPIP